MAAAGTAAAELARAASGTHMSGSGHAAAAAVAAERIPSGVRRLPGRERGGSDPDVRRAELVAPRGPPPIPCPPNAGGSGTAGALLGGAEAYAAAYPHGHRPPQRATSPPLRCLSGGRAGGSPSGAPRIVARLSTPYYQSAGTRNSAWSLLRDAEWSVLRRDEPPEANEGAAVVYHFICRPATPRLLQRVSRAGGLHRVNHLPRSEVICDKRSLAMLLNRLRHRGPASLWDWYPYTCTTAAEWRDALRDPAARRAPWIVKPDHGWGGKGVEVCMPDQVDAACFAERCVVQRYINPSNVLLEGRKFDVRVYVMVPCLSPLRVYAGTEGLVRVCAMPYGDPGRNGNDPRAHVTNRKTNCGEEGYVAGDETGTTGNNRGFAALRGVICRDFWRRCNIIILRTLLAVLPFALDGLRLGLADGRSCFELLAYDFTPAADGSPQLCEVNQRPSFGMRDPWLRRMKIRLFRDMLALLRASESGYDAAAERSRPDPFFECIWPSSENGRTAADHAASQAAAVAEYADVVRKLDPRRRVDNAALEQCLYPHRVERAAAADDPAGVLSGTDDELDATV